MLHFLEHKWQVTIRDLLKKKEVFLKVEIYMFIKTCELDNRKTNLTFFTAHRVIKLCKNQ